MNPSDVVEVQAVVGGDHGDTPFQFGVAVTAKLRCGNELSYELLSSELICRKDTAALIKATNLPRPTKRSKDSTSTRPIMICCYAHLMHLLLKSKTPPKLQLRSIPPATYHTK